MTRTRWTRQDFLNARFDAGLAWVHYPEGLGGLGLSRTLQQVVDAEFAAAGSPGHNAEQNGIGLGMAAPTILAYGSDEQRQRWLRELWTGREVWCQLFSEPGAGSDLASLATRAVRDGDGWVVNGQKVWTSQAHVARRALLLARHDPDLPKHQGLTYFSVDMTAPGVEVRPLRQLTGEAQFNEVFLTDLWIPDTDRIGEVGEGWKVANATLMSERVSIGASRAAPREGGMIGPVAATWRSRPELRTPGLHDRLLRLWTDAEVARLAADRLRQQLAAGKPGPEGSAAKLVFARLNQDISALEVELNAADGLRYDDWSMRRPRGAAFFGRGPGYRYLRARANSIEGGTSEILRNIVAERVLGLPGEPRADKDVPWKDLPTMSDQADLPDLLYSDTERALADSVLSLLADRGSVDKVLARTESVETYDEGLWQAVAGDLGCAGLLIPERDGGAGASYREACSVAEALGAAVAPVPFLGSAVVATAALRSIASGAPHSVASGLPAEGTAGAPRGPVAMSAPTPFTPARAATDLLRRMADGSVTAALAVPFASAPGGAFPVSVRVAGPRPGDGSGVARLRGMVSGIADALPASVLLVPADGVPQGLYLVDVSAAGVAKAPVVSLDMTRQLCDLSFDDAPGTLIASGPAASQALEAALAAGAGVLAGELVGLAQRCLDMTVAYVRERHQFGRPVGSFQALKHRLADVWVAISQARAASRYAAACLAAGDPDAKVAVAMAKAYCSETAVHAAQECVQLHGGIGFTWEHPAHLYLKRAKADSIAFGTPDAHRAALAALVDLPAS